MLALTKPRRFESAGSCSYMLHIARLSTVLSGRDNQRGRSRLGMTQFDMMSTDIHSQVTHEVGVEVPFDSIASRARIAPNWHNSEWRDTASPHSECQPAVPKQPRYVLIMFLPCDFCMNAVQRTSSRRTLTLRISPA